MQCVPARRKGLTKLNLFPLSKLRTWFDALAQSSIPTKQEKPPQLVYSDTRKAFLNSPKGEERTATASIF